MEVFSVTHRLVLLYMMLFSVLSSAQDHVRTWALDEIRIRDPFVLADPVSQTYYMYAQMGNRLNRQHNKQGVEAYTSTDLRTWSGPYSVFEIPPGFWATGPVWSPEVHLYNDRYYLVVTFTGADTLPASPGRPLNQQRGVQILAADSPLGPFIPFHNRAHTPAGCMAVDGTLWVEDGNPWLLYCHEWIQAVDGTVELVQLKRDLSDVYGESSALFNASDAAWVKNIREAGGEYRGKAWDGYVADGPFVYRTKAGHLLMIWSSFSEQQYAVGLAISQSGKIYGPWKQYDEPLFADNRGSGMILRALNGTLMLVVHQPNRGPEERAKFYLLEDEGNSVRVADDKPLIE